MAVARRSKKSEKTFTLHWGSGVIDEEVQIETRFHRPTIQLLKFTAGQAAGTSELRFCHYDHKGRFQRSPLIIAEEDIPALREALAGAPKLKHLLAKLL
jgi:hypothetical protein